MLNLNCVICAELFTQSDDVHVTTCGHMFHFLCLKQWLERSKTCPQCRNKCSDRNIFRVYFNLANLDVSRIDVGSLQEQLDNANLQLKMKEKELNKAEEQIKSAKETQKKCMKTIAGLEKEVKSNNFVVLNYVEKIKVLQNQVKTMDSLRDEVTSLKAQIDSLNGINTLLTASMADAEKLLKTESDPKVLSVCIATLKRELRVCEHKKADIRNQLKAVQNDLRKERDIHKSLEERISQLESENYNLLEKVRYINSKDSKSNTSSSSLDTLQKTPFAKVKEEKRYTISPTIKENIKKIEESSSPYLNIKSSSVGLVPLFKRNLDNPAKPPEVGHKVTTAKITTLKISPSKTAGAVRKAKSDLGEKYSIFKKPRLGLSAAAGAGAKTSSMKPLGPNFVFNGFGGSERVDPFAESNDNDDVIEIDAKSSEAESNAVPSTKLSIHNRLKTGGLRNFKLAK
ncbi:E3 ubiquitin-protein ligase TRAIP-like [Musca vetustissima]|uniref:E3 ubiquitin-protein ligase TRAIP-like n=1 Tax=Musca vetustissima TaxID=27455 RepID=UPI002AB7D4BE|nr:E3 ubiquitin-protein ligase TRAIP-like [Musca vetustissima]